MLLFGARRRSTCAAVLGKSNRLSSINMRSTTRGRMAGGLFFFTLLSSAQTQRPQITETTPLIQSLQGQALYKEYCAACHGQDGKGGGPVAKSLKVAPPDLTRLAMRNGGKFPTVRVEQIISGEEPKPAVHGTREMPIWGPIFSQIAWDQDLGRIRVGNLAKYIEGMQVK